MRQVLEVTLDRGLPDAYDEATFYRCSDPQVGPPEGRVFRLLLRPPTLDRPKAEFSGFDQGDRLVMSPDFVSVIGTLLPIAPCGRSSL